jgi:hypothetical protein
MGGISDLGFRIADLEDSSAAVVGFCNNSASAGRIGGFQHGASDFICRAKSDGANGGAGTAQECAEGAGGFGGGDGVVEKRDQFFAEGLVEMIAESTAEILIFARSESGCDGAGVPGILDGFETIDSRRQETARLRRCDFEVRDQKDEMKSSGDGERLDGRAANDIEATLAGRRGIIGMTFELCAEIENCATLERPPGELIQAVKETGSHGHAAAEAAGLRDVACDDARKSKGSGFGTFEEGRPR